MNDMLCLRSCCECFGLATFCVIVCVVLLAEVNDHPKLVSRSKCLCFHSLTFDIQKENTSEILQLSIALYACCDYSIFGV